MLLQQHNALPCRCNAEQFREFVKGVEAVLSQWTALLLVARHLDAGALQTIHDEVLNWFWEDGEVFSDELQNYFEDFFEAVRYVMVEDGSVKEVSDVLHDMFVQCSKGDYTSVEYYVRALPLYQQANPVQQSVFAGSWATDAEGNQVNFGANEEESDDDEDGDDDGAAAAAEGDEFHVAQAPTHQACANEENEVASTPQVSTKPKQTSNKKNPYKKGNDGWCTVQRKK